LFYIIPKDGLRKKIYYRNGNHKIDIELLRDGFKWNEALLIDPMGKILQFTVENRTSDAHTLPLILNGLKGTYEIKYIGKPAKKILLSGEDNTINIFLTAANSTVIQLKRIDQ
jgi:hypothetical protein